MSQPRFRRVHPYEDGCSCLDCEVQRCVQSYEREFVAIDPADPVIEMGPGTEEPKTKWKDRLWEATRNPRKPQSDVAEGKKDSTGGGALT